MLKRLPRRSQVYPVALHDIASLRQKLLRGEYAPVSQDRASRRDIAASTGEQHSGHTHGPGPSQSPAKEFTRKAATARTRTNAIADIPALAAKRLGKRVAEVGHTDNDPALDEPIR